MVFIFCGATKAIQVIHNEDVECGLYLLPKLSFEHSNLTPYGVMNVKLAVQVLSETVANVLLQYGFPEASETATYCKMMDLFFDCYNVRNNKEYIVKQKKFLKPYSSIDDERFHWILEVFLKYLDDWKQSTQNRPGNFTATACSNMFISWQTYEGFKITCHSLVEVIKFCLEQNIPFIFTERFSQDPLENYFGKQRELGFCKDNPDIYNFGYNYNTIRLQRSSKPIMGNARRHQTQDLAILMKLMLTQYRIV